MRLVKNHLNLEMVRGDTLAFGIKIYKLGQMPDGIWFTCKENYDDKETLFQKTLDDGISVVEQNDDGDYYFRVNVSPTDTLSLEPKKYYYDCVIAANGDIYTIMKGILTIEYNVTD